MYAYGIDSYTCEPEMLMYINYIVAKMGQIRIM